MITRDGKEAALAAGAPAALLAIMEDPVDSVKLNVIKVIISIGLTYTLFIRCVSHLCLLTIPACSRMPHPHDTIPHHAHIAPTASTIVP